MQRRQPATEEILGGVKETHSIAEPPSPSPRQPSTEEGVINQTFHNALEEAATLLLSVLQKPLKDYINELAETTLKIPKWQLLMGSVVTQYESGNLPAPSLDPSWRSVEAILGESVCPECGEIFAPKRFGQKFCSNKCGTAQRQREIEAEKKKREDVRRREREAAREAGMLR